jgi:hypothetical protein
MGITRHLPYLVCRQPCFSFRTPIGGSKRAVKHIAYFLYFSSSPLSSYLQQSQEAQQGKMWLLNTTSLALSAFFGDNTPHYAILSHTWGLEEVSFQDIQRPGSQISNYAGYKKIRDCCAKALEAGFQYVWIDTCCIDKTNSTELSEAINSMFGWYKNATTCYAYLEDVKPEGPGFFSSRWFKRGWTLQELIAPTDVLFFDYYWNEIGTRGSLRYAIGKVTRIPEQVLINGSLHEHCVAEIMSWAAGRQTTRMEDRAYSLLGLFKVNMPLIYGEGKNAFLRLQLEIMKITTDHSILAWNPVPYHKTGALAATVDEFFESGRVRSFSVLNESPFEMTNLGLRITLPCFQIKSQNNQRSLFACLNCKFEDSDALLGIWLNEAASEGRHLGRFVRAFRYLDTMSKNRGLWKRKAKPTSLYIIQSFRPVPQPEDNDPLARPPPTPPFSLEYYRLVRAGYELEAYTTGRRGSLSIQIDECNISFFPERYVRPGQSHGPNIVFFRHSERGMRVWVTFCWLPFQEKLWVMVDGSADEMETPELISKERPLEPTSRNWDKGEFVEHSLINTLYNGEKVEVKLRRAIAGDQVGFTARIAIYESHDRNLDFYPEMKSKKNPVRLQSFLKSSELDDDGSFGGIIKVNRTLLPHN